MSNQQTKSVLSQIIALSFQLNKTEYYLQAAKDLGYDTMIVNYTFRVNFLQIQIKELTNQFAA